MSSRIVTTSMIAPIGAIMLLSGVLPAPSGTGGAVQLLGVALAFAAVLRSLVMRLGVWADPVRRACLAITALLFLVVMTRAIAEESGVGVVVILASTAAYLGMGIAEPKLVLRAFRIAGRCYLSVCTLLYVLPIAQRDLLFGASGGDTSAVERIYRETAFFAVGEDGRFFGLTSSPNAAGALLFAIAVVEMLSIRQSTHRWIPTVSALLAGFFLLLSNSQTAVIATGVAIVVGSLRGSLRRFATMLSWAFGAAPAFIILVNLLGGGRAPFSSDFATGRGQVWTNVSGLLQYGWVTGIDVSELFPAENKSTVGAAHTHNILLQTWALWGLVVFLGLAVAGLFAAYAVGRTRYAPLLAGMAVLGFSSLPIFTLPGSLNGPIAALFAAVLFATRQAGDVVRRERSS